MNASQKAAEVKALLDTARIAKDTREAVDRQLGALAKGNRAVSVDRVPSPFVADDWYGAKYYWGDGGQDRADARVMTPAYPKVRAVNIDTLSDEDIARERTPGSWYPRVEVKFTVQTGKDSTTTLIGDLTKDEAVELATSLLAAASLLH